MHVFRIPLRHRFRGIDAREGIVFEGPNGWGEFSPFLDYSAPVTSHWWRAAEEAASGSWPAPVRTTVPVNTTIPAVDGATAFELAKRSGCTTAKVKVAEGDDEERVAAVREALGPSGKIRVDVNGRWSVEEAATRIATLARFDLEYVEQPVATLEDMAALRRRVDVPLAADESIRNADDPLRVAGLEAADIVVLKVQPLGGVLRCMEIAEACGLPVVVSSAVETSVGLSAGLALAAALPELPYACGLGTATLLEGDIVDDPLFPIDGSIPVRRPTPSAERLAAYEITGSERDAWIARANQAGAGS
jgi:O-succinylbenzoate synthase